MAPVPGPRFLPGTHGDHQGTSGSPAGTKITLQSAASPGRSPRPPCVASRANNARSLCSGAKQTIGIVSIGNNIESCLRGLCPRVRDVIVMKIMRSIPSAHPWRTPTWPRARQGRCYLQYSHESNTSNADLWTCALIDITPCAPQYDQLQSIGPNRHPAVWNRTHQPLEQKSSSSSRMETCGTFNSNFLSQVAVAYQWTATVFHQRKQWPPRFSCQLTQSINTKFLISLAISLCDYYVRQLQTNLAMCGLMPWSVTSLWTW